MLDFSKSRKPKAQGALEYLLLIGGAVLIAVIVITLLLGISGKGQRTTINSAAVALCKQKAAIDQDCDGPTGNRTVTIGNPNDSANTYTCVGTFPDCTVQGCGNGVCESSLGETASSCPADCASAPASLCGNGVIDSSEQCDPNGPNLNGHTCVSEGFTRGTLQCSNSCTFNTACCCSTRFCIECNLQ